MATKKAGAARTPRRSAGSSTRSTARRRSTGTTRRRRTSTYTRRRRPALSTTLGTALGTLVVATLLEASWPVRIGLVVGVLVTGLLYIIWKNRSEIAEGAAEQQPSPASSASSLATDSTAAQGDSPDE